MQWLETCRDDLKNCFASSVFSWLLFWALKIFNFSVIELPCKLSALSCSLSPLLVLFLPYHFLYPLGQELNIYWSIGPCRYAWYRLFTLAKNYNKNLTQADIQQLSCNVLLSALSILPYDPVDFARTEAELEIEKDRSMRMATILGFKVVSTRLFHHNFIHIYCVYQSRAQFQICQRGFCTFLKHSTIVLKRQFWRPKK